MIKVLEQGKIERRLNISVSYTHLDVYKRQGLTYAQNKYNAIIQAATDANQFGYIIDVYKRQLAFFWYICTISTDKILLYNLF